MRSLSSEGGKGRRLETTEAEKRTTRLWSAHRRIKKRAMQLFDMQIW